ncbi:CRISPR-associated protein [Clostridiales bacterium PH28_bin88]|nr:CRISPR-associated protein [Clostridiales bacterium PH28_bin88]
MEIKTLTPLWTGGVKSGRVDRIQETGIIGSLRWWYEAILRGLGGKVCDPTTQKCLYDPEKPNNGLCDVCKIFGATGWRRRFRLVVHDHTTHDPSVEPRVVSTRRYTTPGGQTRTPTWYFPDNLNDKPRSGNLTIQIQGTTPDFQPVIIGGLLQFVADWGTVGARAQMGFGVFEPANGRLDTKPLYDGLISSAGTCTYTTIPSLQNIFLARIRLENATVRDTFDLKYDLRQLFSGQQNSPLRHFIMGTVQGRRMAAKVKISRPYDNGLMRVWGWIPEDAGVYQGFWNRNSVVDVIYHHLSTNYALEVWREVNSPRDTVAPNISSTQALLRSLLRLEEGDNAE